jgi:hypothetical protein
MSANRRLGAKIRAWESSASRVLLCSREVVSGFADRMGDLSHADSGFGEEMAEPPGVLALRLNEKLVALELAGVLERGGEKLVPQGLGFQMQSFFPQGAIETEAYFVRFAFELR